MNPESLTLVCANFDKIALTVDMFHLVDQMHLANFLTQQQANTVKSFAGPIEMFRALLSIIEKQSAGFHNLCFALQKCKYFDVLQCMNPVSTDVVKDLLAQHIPLDNSRQTFDFSVSQEWSLEAMVLKHPVTGAKVPVAKFHQHGYPPFYITTAQVSVLRSQHYNFVKTSDMGSIRVCCLGAEAPGFAYDGVAAFFDPHNKAHLEALNEDHGNVINQHLNISSDSQADNRSIMYDGFHVFVRNTESESGVVSSLLVSYAEGCQSARLLDVPFDDFDKLQPTLDILLRLLPALPDLPLPAFVPTFISESVLKLATDCYFNAVAKYTKQMLRASESWECGGCAIDGLEHTCRRNFCTLLNENLAGFVANHLSLPATQAKIQLIMFKIAKLMLSSVAAGYVFDILSAKFGNEEIPDGDLLKNILIYHGVRNLVPSNKVFELEHFVEQVISYPD